MLAPLSPQVIRANPFQHGDMFQTLKRLAGKKGSPEGTGDNPSAPSSPDELVNIRSYRRPDRRAILEIAREAFSGVSLDENIEQAFGAVGGHWTEHKKDAVDYDLQNNPSLALVAELGDEIAGFACNRIYPARSTGHIANVAVEERYRRRKIGRWLVEGSMELLRQKGMKYVRIETLEQNERGRNFYPALGFEEIGRQIFYFKRL